MSKPISHPTRLAALASMLMLAVLLTVMPPAGAPGPRPPLVAPIAALSRKLDGRLGAAARGAAR
ncbi:MAG: hypothetical protein E2591_27255 [Achromobacter sp.]|uniref:hypothetical protein n=1 Tax=Achromobacter sp. TaxID=134375 RepID=UPI0012CC1F0C|nr:hypothetical protein [Achromobacter sp.]MPS81772.1 hypothetical protein [Achromobacter sp.]